MLTTSTAVSIRVASATPGDTDALVLFSRGREIVSDVALLPEDVRAEAGRLLASPLAPGKASETVVHLMPAGSTVSRLVVVSVGATPIPDRETLRRATAAGLRAAGSRVADLALALPPAARVDPSLSADAVATAAMLASFRFDEFKGAAREARKPPKRRLTLLADAKSRGVAAAAAERGRIVGEATNFARTVASRPGNVVNPPVLASIAKELAGQVGLRCRVLDEAELRKLKMGGMLAVGAGSSATPPRLIALEWTGAPKGKPARGEPLLVVGKAITFDTGGVSIKPAEKMGRMIFDKCGGMAVLGLMYAVATLKLPVRVVGLLAAAENHLSATAYRPGDILRMYNGVTVDVTNTDAEGRLVLGDALSWGIETYKPSAVIDLATLTGACVVSLGHHFAGAWCNDESLHAELVKASSRSGERFWRMPLDEAFREMLKADAADIVNSPGRWGGANTAAAFLWHFIPPGTKWCHFDIAGTAESEKDLPLTAKGATGWGVRTLVEWVQQHARTRR
jgi:leucyl aminopeptidase